MGDIIDPRCTSMNIDTFGSIQTVKYTLVSRNQSAIEMFRRDVKFGKVDKKLCSNISSAGVRDKAQRQRKLLRVRERRMEFDCQPTTSAAEKRLEAIEEEHIARKRRIAKQRKPALEDRRNKHFEVFVLKVLAGIPKSLIGINKCAFILEANVVFSLYLSDCFIYMLNS